MYFSFFCSHFSKCPNCQNDNRTKNLIVLKQNYFFRYETSNGISQQESGQLQNAGQENESIAVRGQFSYTLDGVTYTVTYIADDQGFRPEGAHLPHSK